MALGLAVRIVVLPTCNNTVGVCTLFPGLVPVGEAIRAVLERTGFTPLS